MQKISLVRTSLISTSIILGTTVFGALVWWQQMQLQTTKVVFLNVGQGDAILIQQGRHQILIDSGKNGKQLLTELGRYVPFWDRHIEVIVPTHPDADHIGGFAFLSQYYSVGRVLWTGVESESEVYKQFRRELLQRVSEENWHQVVKGVKLTLPAGGEATVLYPETQLAGKAKDEDTNATSIVLRFQYGETSLLLTGDLANEEMVLTDLQPATVLKAAHHGSKYSTSDTFLTLTKPQEVVISVGKNNYGHPTKEVLERIEKAKARVIRTDQEGSVEYRCSKMNQRCAYVGRRVF